MKNAAAAVLILALSAGCGRARTQPETPDNPQPPPAPAPGDVTLNGSERLAWTQDAAGSDVRTFGFVAYVDDARAVLGNVTCTGSPPSCSASLPPMSPGRHVLQLAAVRPLGAGYIEGERSAPIAVTMLRGGASETRVSDAAPPADVLAPSSAAAGAQPSSPPAPLSRLSPAIDVVSRDVDGVSSLAAAPGGDLFVAERRGVIRILRRGVILDTPALMLADVIRDSDDVALLSLVLSPDFENDRRVYFLYRAATRDGPAYFVAAGREIEGRIGEVATLMNAGPALAGAAAAVRVARDGTLRVSVSDRISRINADGSTPAGTRGFSRVIAAVPGLRALDWGGDGNDLYALASTSTARVLIRIAPPDAAREHQVVHQWQPEDRPVALAWYGRTEIAELTGRMLVGTAGGTVQAIDVDARARPPIDIALGEVGAVTALAVDSNGSVFVAVAASRMKGSASRADTETVDVILRLHAREGGK